MCAQKVHFFDQKGYCLIYTITVTIICCLLCSHAVPPANNQNVNQSPDVQLQHVSVNHHRMTSNNINSFFCLMVTVLQRRVYLSF